MKARSEIDGTITIRLTDDRTFVLAENEDGTLSIQSNDGNLLIRPVAEGLVEIDTPLT